MSQNLVYAEVGPHVASATRPRPLQAERVQYASLVHNAIVTPPPQPSDLKQDDVGMTTHLMFSM